MSVWLKLYAGAIAKMLKNINTFRSRSIFMAFLIVGLLFSLTSIIFAQENFSHNFKAMYVPQGKVITITLESNPTTGFSWQLVGISDKMILEFVKKEYIPNNKKMIGAGGIEKWSFKTLKTGKAVISLVYRRPWEKDIPAQATEEFNVFVK